MEKENLLKRANLLEDAYREFCHEFNATPEESGYLVHAFWDNTVIFAPSQKEADAFIKVQKIKLQMASGTVVFSLLFLVILSCLLIIAGVNGSLINNWDEVYICFWTVLGITVLVFIYEIVEKIRCRNLDKIFCNKIVWYLPRLKSSSFKKL